MQIAFILTLVVCAAYFLWRKQADPFSLGFASLVVYFAPGAFGYVHIPIDGVRDYTADLAPMATAIMLAAILILTALTIVFDRTYTASGRTLTIAGERYFAPILTAFMAVTAAISIKTVGPYYLCVDKNQVLNHIDIWYYYAAYSIPLSFAAALILRQWLVVAICAGFILADIYIGFRDFPAICFLSSALLFGEMIFDGWRKAIKFFVICGLCAFGLVFINQVTYTAKAYGDFACQAEIKAAKVAPRTAAPKVSAVAPIKHSQVNATIEYFITRTLTRADIYKQAFINSEPFVTQSILNATIQKDFRTDRAYLLRQILSGVPGGKSLFGIDSTGLRSFNDLAQHILFPRIKTFKVANNPWAQMYAAFGFEGCLIFAIFYAGALVFFAWTFHKTDGALKAVIAVTATWFAFYFQRNDLLIEIGILKQTVYTAAIAMCLSATIATLSKYRGRVVG